MWQALARAEPIDVYPLLRPFAVGLCIMFFPTFVLGTINTVLSPVVKGCHGMLETQTFDMNKYREQKDKLEYEANKRNPETAYLVDKEEFDKKLDELGWSAGDLITMGGMYIDRAEYRMKQNIRQVVSGTLGTAVPVRRAGDRHDTDVLSDRPLHLGAYRLCDKRL